MLLGVVGGMGPEASNVFCKKLIDLQSSSNDQEKLPFVHYCNPKIPDRTAHILKKGLSPMDELIKTATSLEAMGCSQLVIPCNTAHYYIDKIKKKINIEIIDLIESTVNQIKLDYPDIKKVGLLATSGTLKTKLYKQKFRKVGISLIEPNLFDQENLVMNSIYDVKRGNKKLATKNLELAGKKLIDEGAQVLILGCTEIPLVIGEKLEGVLTYDPMNIVASKVVEIYENFKNLSENLIETEEIIGVK